MEWTVCKHMSVWIHRNYINHYFIYIFVYNSFLTLFIEDEIINLIIRSSLPLKHVKANAYLFDIKVSNLSLKKYLSNKLKTNGKLTHLTLSLYCKWVSSKFKFAFQILIYTHKSWYNFQILPFAIVIKFKLPHWPSLLVLWQQLFPIRLFLTLPVLSNRFIRP